MATIGTFTAQDNGYIGSIKTLTLNIKAKFSPSDKENDKAPDYRIFAGTTEFGAAWKKTARDSDREYLSVKLDESSEYPGLIKQGERIQTIAVPTALVAFNWPAGTNRNQRVTRFVDALFSRIDKLQGAGFDPKWKSINLAATVPGLNRFAAAQEWLDRQARAARLSR